MAQFDLSLAELQRYRPELPVPDDFAQFWAQTLSQARSHELAPVFTKIDNGLTVVDTFDVTFAGFDGQPIRGWLHLPSGALGRLPTVVEYIGYGGGRGLPHERNLFAQAGYAHFVMDTRGQASTGSVGETPDVAPDGGAPAHPGYMTRGILDPSTYYYRRVFTDAVRAVEAARSHPSVDPGRVAVTGGSQGGGITLAVAGLVDDLVGVLPDVPFLCNFPRAITITDENPYGEIIRYLRAHRDHLDQVHTTLSYFDGVAMAARANAPALFSVALMDEICPPSTVYSAYNHYPAEKQINVYPFNEHEGGQGFQDLAKLRWLAERF